MKAGKFLFCLFFFLFLFSPAVFPDNSLDIEVSGIFLNIPMDDYNSYIDNANEKNKSVGVYSPLKKIENGLAPEINICYQMNFSSMILGLYLKNQYIFVFNGSGIAEWGSGKPAQIIEADLNIMYSGIGTRLSLSNGDFPYLTGFIGVDAGLCYYFWNRMYEETNQEDGTNIYKISKQWTTIIPGVNIDAGIQWMLNETVGFGIKGGYRLATGSVTVKINNINGWTGTLESEDTVNYSGFYGGAGMTFKFNIAQKKAEDDKIDKSAKFPGLSEWLYKEAKSLYEEGLYKQAKEKVLEAEKIAGENEMIMKLKGQIDKELNSENKTEKINRLLKRADECRYKKQFKEAGKLYREIISMDEGNKQALFYLDEFDKKAKEKFDMANELMKEGKLKDALKCVNLSIEYGIGKQGEDLKELLEEKISRNKEKDKLYNQGVDKYRKGEYEEAIKKWQQVLQIDPSDKDAQDNIKKATAKLKETNKEESAEIKKSIEEAKSFYNIGNFDAALEKCEYVLRLNPDNDECKKIAEKIKKIQEENKVEVIKKR